MLLGEDARGRRHIAVTGWRKGLFLLSAFALASTGLTACLGSTPVAKKAGPIKLGMIAPLTGPYSALGTNDEIGAKMAVAQINRAGGIEGRKIALIVQDDQTNPTQAVLDYHNLVADGVVGVVGSVFSSSSLATVPSADAAKIPMISTAGAGTLVNPVHPYVFMTPPTTRLVDEQMLAYARYKGWTRVEVANDTTGANMAAWQELQQMAPRYGITLREQSFSLTSTDFSALLTHVKTSGAQALMVWGAGPAEVILTQQFKSMGLTMPLLMCYAEASFLYTRPVGAAGNGVRIAAEIQAVGPYMPTGPLKRQTMSFVNAFQPVYHYYPPEFAMDAYSAVELFAAAIRKAGSVTPTAIDAALNHISLLTPEGTYTYTPTDHSGLSVKDVVITIDRNGTLVPTRFTRNLLRGT